MIFDLASITALGGLGLPFLVVEEAVQALHEGGLVRL
jgi:hypothetical protein